MNPRETPPRIEAPDGVLVRAVREGDSDAFEVLMNRYEEPLRKRVRTIVGSVDLVQDILQEVFLAAWTKLLTLREDDRFGAWLFGIAENIAAKKRRRARTDVLRAADTRDAVLEQATAGRTPHAEVEDEMVKHFLRREAEKLPARYRETLILHLDGLSSEAIARELQTTRAAVQQRITRARQMLLKSFVPLFGALMLKSKPSEAFSAAVMRALRAEGGPGQPRRAVAAKGKLLSWLLSVGAAVVLLGALVKGIGLVRRWSGRASTAAMTGTLSRSQGPASSDRSPLGRPRRSPPALVAPDEPAAPSEPERDEPASPLSADQASDPDYVLWTDATRADSAFQGAHGGQPLDPYGRELLELIDQSFFRQLAWCFREHLMGEARKPKVDFELSFSLLPGRLPLEGRSPGATVAEERDVSYRMAGMSLSNMVVSICVRRAFDATRFPAPRDGASLSIKYRMSVDLAAVDQAIEGLCAAIPP